MKKYFILITFLSSFLSFSQNRKNNFDTSITSSEDYSVYIRIKDKNFKNQKTSRLFNFLQENQIDILNNLEEKISVLKKQNNILNDQDENNILKNIYQLQINSSNNNLIEIAKRLESFDEVEYVDIISNKPIQPPFINLNNQTPNLDTQQNYLDNNPGLDVKYAWSLGVTGQNINVIDIEYGFRKSHEMINKINHVQLENNVEINPALMDPTSSFSDFIEHGTAVASIMTSNNDGIGITGTTHNLKSFTTYLEWTNKGYDRVDAIVRALGKAKPGDIIIYEMQTAGQNGKYVPAEYNNIIWDLTKIATNAGITIVASAGNGNQDLDSEFYKSYMNRGNSGAIIVGGGSDDINHSKLSFSTYGSRVDLQGWGQGVLAAGYGNWQNFDNTNNRSYTLFNGTSSAVPLVASAAILVQSYYYQKTGEYLSPIELKNILIETGIKQNGDNSKNIGPFPNIKTAIESINNVLNISDPVKPLETKIYPNPTKDVLKITNNEGINLDYEIFDFNGNIIISGKTKEQINLSFLKNGVYMIKITDGKRINVEKLIKN